MTRRGTFQVNSQISKPFRVCNSHHLCSFPRKSETHIHRGPTASQASSQLALADHQQRRRRRTKAASDVDPTPRAHALIRPLCNLTAAYFDLGSLSSAHLLRQNNTPPMPVSRRTGSIGKGDGIVGQSRQQPGSACEECRKRKLRCKITIAGHCSPTPSPSPLTSV
jgi:hypothetical protein